MGKKSKEKWCLASQRTEAEKLGTVCAGTPATTQYFQLETKGLQGQLQSLDFLSGIYQKTFWATPPRHPLLTASLGLKKVALLSSTMVRSTPEPSMQLNPNSEHPREPMPRPGRRSKETRNNLLSGRGVRCLMQEWRVLYSAPAIQKERVDAFTNCFDDPYNNLWGNNYYFCFNYNYLSSTETHTQDDTYPGPRRQQKQKYCIQVSSVWVEGIDCSSVVNLCREIGATEIHWPLVLI